MKDRLFLDTNIILDLLGERIPFYSSAAKLASLADQKKIILVSSTLSIATVYYILRKYEGDKISRGKLSKFCIISEITDLKAEFIAKGLTSGFTDFEDSLQYYSALHSKSSFLITRNKADFIQSELPVMTVDEYLSVSR